MQSFLHTSVEKGILRLLEDLATPTSLRVEILMRYGEWDQLATLKLDPTHYVDADRFWRDAMATSIIRKTVELPSTVDRKAVAEETFISCERECLRANHRLYPYLAPGLPETDVGVCAYLERARKIVKTILGPCPDTNTVRQVLGNKTLGSPRYVVRGKFGPGATFGDRGRFTTVPDKMSSAPTLTTEAWSYLFPWVDTQWACAVASSGRDPSFTRGNRFTTVKKDALKDRGIAVEPGVNVFYQLGYAKIIRSRLKIAGIDLQKGQDIHRRLACEASIKGHLSTLDLSNASDTICRNLVKLLLPSRWFSVMDDLRSHRTLFRGNWWLLEKFSSMGNGFTFELETLIFLSLVLALDPTGQKLVPGRSVWVFGDDIIVPTESSKDVMSALSFFGMTVNMRKSFVDGPFRESCGGDFFNGVDVRPHFLEESPSEPHQLISLVNGLARASRHCPVRRSVVHRARLAILDGLPSEIKSCRGPFELGDLVISDDDEERWRTRHRSQIRYIKVWRPARFKRVAWKHFKPECILACAVYGTGSATKGVIPRGGVIGYKVGWIPYS